MPRRTKAAQQETGFDPPAELRGQNAQGQVRPADDRYLTPEQIEQRDAYVEAETGPDAQQLVIKREHPEHVEEIASRDRGKPGKEETL